MSFARLALYGLGFIATREAYTAFVGRRQVRAREYAVAQAHARAIGAPLLVLGDPDTGFITRHFGRDYGCGDVCTDVSGCPACPSRLQGRAEDVLPLLPSRSHVIFVSLTLEYVDDLPRVIAELERIAVDRTAIHVVAIEPGSSTFFLYPGAKWVVRSAPPKTWSFRRYGTGEAWRTA